MSTEEVIRLKFPPTWHGWLATYSLLQQVTEGLFSQEIELEQVGGKCWKEYGKRQLEWEGSRQEHSVWICWKIYQLTPGAHS